MNRRHFLIAGGAVVLGACSPNPAPSDKASGESSSTTNPPAEPAATSATTATATAPTAPTAATTVASSAPTTPGGPAAYVAHGSRTSAQAALTFHANGDVALTTTLMEIAEKRKAPLTIFAVGSWLEANPAMAARITTGGHELANHTYTHPSLGQLGAAAVAAEITKSRDVIARLLGRPSRWFRPSGIDVPTALILAEAGKAGYSVSVGYDVDPADYADPGAAAIEKRVKAGLRAGSIVSLHMGHAGTVTAMPAILDALAAAGLAPVTVSTLLGG